MTSVILKVRMKNKLPVYIKDASLLPTHSPLADSTARL